jgi:hypothetical protein
MQHLARGPRQGCSIQQHLPRSLDDTCEEKLQNPAQRGIRSHPGRNALPLSELKAHVSDTRDQ